MWEGGGNNPVSCNRRESAQPVKHTQQPVALRRSRRRVQRTYRLGVREDPIAMAGDSSSATTRTSDQYAPGASMTLVSLGSRCQDHGR